MAVSTTSRAEQVRRFGALLAPATVLVFLAASLRTTPAMPPQSTAKPTVSTRHVRGRVVFLQEESAKIAHVQVVDSATTSVLGIVAANGERILLFENERVHAFRIDKRLRGIPLELVIAQDARVPFAQLLRIFEWQGDQRMEVLYWCDICAIAANQPGPCACCQEDVELRRIPAPPAKGPTSPPTAGKR